MMLFKGITGYRELKRSWAITRVLLKYGGADFGDRLRGWRKGSERLAGEELPPRQSFPSPGRLRQALEELGPSFIKLGQLMSTRADIFPPEYIEEFRKLQDQVPPNPFPEIKAVIEKELKRPLSGLFPAFNPVPMAAASVGQVHVARLFSGDKVAVKIIRPGIDKRIREDIRLMYRLANRLEKTFEVARVIGVVTLVQEFERVIFRELDMLIEAGSIEKFAQNFRRVDEITIPRVYWDLTTRSVLVMEHIEGVKMDQVQAIRSLGIDPKEIALIGLRSFSMQLMKFGFFHADPHPGNTIVMPDGRVGLIDFGITGYMDEEMMRQIANLFLGYAEHDYDLVMDALLEAGLVPEKTQDLGSFRADLKDMSEAFYGRSLQNISVKDVYDQVMQLVLKYRIRLPRNILLLLKTFIQTEALGKILGSDASLLEVAKPYARELLQRGYEARSLFRNLGRDANTLSQYARAAPKYIHDILRATSEGRQRLELSHSGFDPLTSQMEKGVNRLTIGLVIAASITAAALVLNSPEKLLELQVDLLGLGKVALTGILGLTGYVVATLLGVWLIISILRSGKL
jgi:ubiquinone biosynthesis protein